MTRRTTKNERKLIDFVLSTKRYTWNKLYTLGSLIEDILIDWHRKGNPLLTCYCDYGCKYGIVEINFEIVCSGYSFRQNKDDTISITTRLIDCKDKESVINFIDDIKSLTKYIISNNCIKEEFEGVYTFHSYPFQDWLSTRSQLTESLWQTFFDSSRYTRVSGYIDMLGWEDSD